MAIESSPVQNEYARDTHDPAIVSPSQMSSAKSSPRSLDDRFHEGGNHGTDDLLADSSFAVSGTRSGIMARWRQAVEVAMTDEEIVWRQLLVLKILPQSAVPSRQPSIKSEARSGDRIASSI